MTLPRLSARDNICTIVRGSMPWLTTIRCLWGAIRPPRPSRSLLSTSFPRMQKRRAFHLASGRPERTPTIITRTCFEFFNRIYYYMLEKLAYIYLKRTKDIIYSYNSYTAKINPTTLINSVLRIVKRILYLCTGENQVIGILGVPARFVTNVLQTPLTSFDRTLSRIDCPVGIYTSLHSYIRVPRFWLGRQGHLRAVRPSYRGLNFSVLANRRNFIYQVSRLCIYI